MTALICSLCDQPANPNNMFRVVDGVLVNRPICFACIFAGALGGSKCVRCGNSECAALLANGAGGRIVPAAVCYNCILELPPPTATESRTIVGDRTIVENKTDSEQ